MDVSGSSKFTDWEPGDRGKGVLVPSDPRRLEIWKVDDFGSPHHAEGLLALGLDETGGDVCFAIDDAGLTVHHDDDIDKRSPGDVIREIDPRVPLDASGLGSWGFG